MVWITSLPFAAARRGPAPLDELLMLLLTMRVSLMVLKLGECWWMFKRHKRSVVMKAAKRFSVTERSILCTLCFPFG